MAPRPSKAALGEPELQVTAIALAVSAANRSSEPPTIRSEVSRNSWTTPVKDEIEVPPALLLDMAITAPPAGMSMVSENDAVEIEVSISLS